MSRKEIIELSDKITDDWTALGSEWVALSYEPTNKSNFKKPIPAHWSKGVPEKHNENIENLLRLVNELIIDSSAEPSDNLKDLLKRTSEFTWEECNSDETFGVFAIRRLALHYHIISILNTNEGKKFLNKFGALLRKAYN